MLITLLPAKEENGLWTHLSFRANFPRIFAFSRAAQAQVFSFSADFRAKNTIVFILIAEHRRATLFDLHSIGGLPAHLLGDEQFVAFEGQEWFCAKYFRSSLKSWCLHHQKFSTPAKRSRGSSFLYCQLFICPTRWGVCRCSWPAWEAALGNWKRTSITLWWWGSTRCHSYLIDCNTISTLCVSWRLQQTATRLWPVCEGKVVFVLWWLTVQWLQPFHACK